MNWPSAFLGVGIACALAAVPIVAIIYATKLGD